MKQRIAAAGSQVSQLVDQFNRTQAEEMVLFGKQVGALFSAGGQLLIAGQGPFLPLAQMLASHFTHRLGFDRPVLPAVALGSDPVLAAALAASDRPEQLLARHFRALCGTRQQLLLLSDGTDNPALRLLRDEVLENGFPVALLTPEPKDDPLCSEGVNICISLGSASRPRLLEMSLFVTNLLCEMVEAELFGI